LLAIRNLHIVPGRAFALLSIVLALSCIAPPEAWAQQSTRKGSPESAVKRTKRPKNATATSKNYGRPRLGGQMERSYRKSPGRYQGNVELRPKALDYNAIRARVERNPGRKNLKTYKNRQSYFRASSGRMQRSLGRNTVRIGGARAPRYPVGRPGSSGLAGALRPGNRYYQKKSMEIQRDQGNITVVPASRRRDYNELRSRIDPNPSRTGYRNVKTAEATRARKSSEVQSFAGDQRSARNRTTLLGRHGAATSGRYSGDLRRSSPLFRQQAAAGPAATGRYSGDLRTLRPRHQAQAMEGKSLNASQHGGEVRVHPRASVDRYYKRSSSGNYRGDQLALRKGYRQQAMEGKSLNTSQFEGNGKLSWRDRRGTTYSRSARVTGDYRGDLATRSAANKRQEQRVVSRESSLAGGNLRVMPKGSQERWYRRDAAITGNYRGSARMLRPKYSAQQLQGKSLNSSQHGGTIPVLSRSAQDRWYRRDAARTGNYRGPLLTKNERARRQELEGKSLNSSQYQGELRARSQTGQDRQAQRTAGRTGAYQGDLKVRNEAGRDREYRRSSASTGSYQGGLRARTERFHDREMEGKSLAVSRYAGSVKVMSKGSQDRWYRRDSKMSGNYQGDWLVLKEKYRKQALEGKSLNSSQYTGSVRTMTQAARGRYYRDLSDRNLTQAANFRTKSRLYRNLEYQYLSATVQNYQGGPKTSLATRLWLSVTDGEGERMRKKDYVVRKPRYDTREAKIWY
jgi:hypothetical protein